MDKKKYTTKEVIIKMLEPLKHSKMDVFWLFLRWVYFWSTGAILAYSMNLAINAVTIWNIDLFQKILIWLSIVLLSGPMSNYFIRNIDNRLFRNTQSYLYEKYLKAFFTLDNNVADQYGTGKMNSIIQKWADNWVQLIKALPLDLTTMILRIVLALWLIASSVWWMWFLITLILFIISFLIAQWGNKKLAPVRKEVRDLYVKTDKEYVRNIMSKHEVLQNNKIIYEITGIKKLFQQILSLWYKDSQIRIYATDIQRIWIVLIQIFLFGYVGYWVMNWNYAIWILAMVWMLSNQINGNIQDLNQYISQIHSQMIYVYNLRDLFDNAKPIIWYDLDKSFMPWDWTIILENISYTYGQNKEVINNLSLTLIWGKKTALVGISGSGKSTIVKLLAWYLHSTKWEILVDWQKLPNVWNLNDAVSLSSYYPYIGYLTQEPNVFDATIRENLMYWVLDWEATDEAMQQALLQAQCQFVFDFKDGLDTEIWEKGIRLSWWQRQRLAIAKIILKDPKIVLLDEPTSALDSFSEEEVTKAFDALFEWRTVIVIAHRLQTVKKADDIIVLDQWQVIERWTHDQLVAQWWQYAKMLELQSGF